MLIPIQFPSRTTNRWSVVIQGIKDMTETNKTPQKITSATSVVCQGSLYTANIHTHASEYTISSASQHQSCLSFFLPSSWKGGGNEELHPETSLYKLGKEGRAQSPGRVILLSHTRYSVSSSLMAWEMCLFQWNATFRQDSPSLAESPFLDTFGRQILEELRFHPHGIA